MPKKSSSTSSRKADHIRINLEQNVRSGLTTGLENYRFVHQALPELNLDDIRLDLSLFGKDLAAPLFISSMTGGTEDAGTINRNLAAAAQETGIPLGVGSQRAALEDPDLADTFQVRDTAPDILLFANLGAVQLNYGLSVEDCRQAVNMIGADALILHLNPLQEAVMPDGNTRFAGLLDKIEGVCKTLDVPVIIKEVGWGFSRQAAVQLKNAGVSALDVAGAGGTSWTKVEMHRAETDPQRKIASAFVDWGIPTAETVQIVHSAVPELPIFASGGLRNGVDIAKCITLGAVMGGLAGPFLKAAVHSPQAVISEINRIKKEIQLAMFATGVSDLDSLSRSQLIKNSSP
ncbi:MAG: type 2 isopentenyl-diphosphate Delta-isomerase [Anaerolineales bacterium]